MHSHLDIKVNGKSLVIPEDSSLSVEEKNPMFNDVTFFSYPMQIPVEGNREVLKNIAHRDSDMRAMDLEHADARIFADGLPLNHGQVITQDGSEIKDSFDFNIDAQQQSFSELIGDLECRDVAVKDDICIGEQLGVINYKATYTAKEREVQIDRRDGHVMKDETRIESDVREGIIDVPIALGFSYPARTQGFPLADRDNSSSSSVADGQTMAGQSSSSGFGHGGGNRESSGFGNSSNSGSSSTNKETYNPVITESFINVSKPYPFPYCNARVCYAHRGVKTNEDKTQETEGYVLGNERNPNDIHDFGQYWCLDAFRQQSGMCFYVLYFLDCLFKQLGVIFDNSELLEVEDLKRLCFFTTVCKFDIREIRNEEWPNGKKLNSYSDIDDWLRSHNCSGRGSVSFGVATNDRTWYIDGQTINISDTAYSKDWGFGVEGNLTYHTDVYREIIGTIECQSEIYEMYANSDNFPNKSVSSIISSLENTFGIRFLYDPEKRTVKARFLRNLYKDNKVHTFQGKVISMTPETEKITGVRVMYSSESDKKEQRNNVRYGVKDYDTEYDYIEFPEERTEENPLGRTITNLTYNEIIDLVTATNNNVYVDKTTGNVYRVKINSEASDTVSLKPVLFQVGQYKGIEEGDCSDKNKDYIKEFVSEFTPLSQNIVNALEYTNDKEGLVSPIFAPYLDVDMEHEYLTQKVQSILLHDMVPASWSGKAFAGGLEILFVQNLSLAESYDPTQTEDGNSPLQDIDWGLTIAVMRGAGSDSEIIEYDRDYDGFDNSKWKDTIAVYEIYSDSMDPKGAIFDYNGTGEGDGGGERFSLAIRAWKQPEWSNIPLCDDDERDPETGLIINKIRNRGVYDSFLSPHAYFLLHRKKFKVKVMATVAQLLDIRNHWTDRYVLDGKAGFINMVKYNIEKATGVGEAELEFYAL